MEEDTKTISINPEDLVARLHEVENSAQGDIARIIELLLVENHVLKRQQSVGLSRGVGVRLETYPRFLKLQEQAADDNPDNAEGEANASDT